MVTVTRASQRATRVEAWDTSLAAVLQGLNAIALRATIWLAPLSAIAYALIAVQTGRTVFWVMAIQGMVVAGIAAISLRREPLSLEWVLIVSALMLPVVAAAAPGTVRGALWAAFVTFTAVGGLLVPPGAVPRTLFIVTTIGLVGPATWPVMGLATWGTATVTVAITALTIGFAASTTVMARSALERSERIRLDIFRRVPIGLFRTSVDGRFLDANPALAEILGYDDPSELRAIPPAAIYADPGDRVEFFARLECSDEPERFAHRLRKRDGTPVWVRGHAQCVRSHDGEVRYFEGSIEDVTQRREIERVSRLNEERFRNVFHRAPIALWEEDWTAVGERLDGLRASGITDLRAHLAAHPMELVRLISLVEFLDVNPAGVDLMGAESKQQALAAAAPASPGPEAVASFTEQFVGIWEDTDHFEFDIEARTIDGRGIDCHLSWAAARSDGRVDLSRVVIAFSDVSAIKQAERDLAGLVESKDELVASVSHVLRTPITTILGMALEMRDHNESFNEQERTELLGLIADQSRELADIVEDLLIAARAEGETLVIRPEVLDVHQEAQRVLASLSDRSVATITDPGRPVLAFADPLRFRQILRNLLTNAERYGGGRVTVSMERNGVAAHIRVTDDGPGVPAAEITAVFEPYHRSRESGLPGSIGLGLPVSRRLARLMSGDLTYRRTNETVFELCLPVPGNPEGSGGR